MGPLRYAAIHRGHERTMAFSGASFVCFEMSDLNAALWARQYHWQPAAAWSFQDRHDAVDRRRLALGEMPLTDLGNSVGDYLVPDRVGDIAPAVVALPDRDA